MLSSFAFSVPTGDMEKSMHPLATHAVLSGLQLPPGAHGQAWLDWTQPWKPFQYYDSVCFVLSPDALALLLFATWEGQSGCEQVLHPTSCCFSGSRNCLRCQEVSLKGWLSSLVFSRGSCQTHWSHLYKHLPSSGVSFGKGHQPRAVKKRE